MTLSNFFYQYILQGFFILLFVLFGIAGILMMYNWIRVVIYLRKIPKFRKKFFIIGIFPAMAMHKFAWNKDYLHDKYIEKYKSRTRFFMKLALIVWVSGLVTMLLVALFAYIFNIYY